MIRIKPLTLDDGSQILVEVEQADVSLAGPADNLPTGAEPTGLGGKLDDAMAMMRNSIGAMARNVHASLSDQSPDEWAMEVSIGFKGETQPIPVIVTGSATGSVKVTAKWKRAD
ncbi:MAG: hypothetical protein LJE69_07750 [Thiohalocapsa sp.]|jgi:hypothetical protein|uniref:CU044_2847 family protein n=1 Tax=Thiohalocapsa sp. TaxID=2497641 RepID=UPI0025EE7F15|nr:CU044_2847 family protein [Thiohalocapsa sp.]MCG6941129.1 hypothetical protein [Thiohalocapsa sp.]